MKKRIIVGVTSSIATYKSVQLISDLLKKGYDVEVIMSENATRFVSPLTFSSLTKHKTYVETFDRHIDYNVEHISLAKKADAFIIAPATANIIAKVANGICDDMLSTTFLASNCPKLIAPAMNTQMLNNPITQTNLKRCIEYGMHIIDSEFGLLACGDVGTGKLASIPKLIEAIEMVLVNEKPLLGKHVLVSAGPSVEPIDPVRYLSNYSSGKMGYALARAAFRMGATVTLVSGPTALEKPFGVNVIDVVTTQEMYDACDSVFDTCDYFISAAAPADYRVERVASQKIKKTNDVNLSLIQNIDILKTLASRKTHQKVCGFAAETQNVYKHANQKLIDKNCDILVMNDVSQAGAGFNHDTNIISILTKTDKIDYEKMDKQTLSFYIMQALINS